MPSLGNLAATTNAQRWMDYVLMNCSVDVGHRTVEPYGLGAPRGFERGTFNPLGARSSAGNNALLSVNFAARWNSAKRPRRWLTFKDPPLYAATPIKPLAMIFMWSIIQSINFLPWNVAMDSALSWRGLGRRCGGVGLIESSLSSFS